MVYALLILIIAGVAYTIKMLTDIREGTYHVEPYDGFVSATLFGGEKELKTLEKCKALLYIQQKDMKNPGEKYLNIMVPLPRDTVLNKFTERFMGATVVIELEFISVAPLEPNSTVYHKTLIPIGQGVDEITVSCTMGALGPIITSGNTGDSDDMDPVSGEDPTPYLSGVATATPSLAAYLGSEASSITVKDAAGAVIATIPSSGSMMQAVFGLASSTFEVVCGRRKVKNIR
jgi:hypothetical protein